MAVAGGAHWVSKLLRNLLIVHSILQDSIGVVDVVLGLGQVHANDRYGSILLKLILF